MPGDWMSEPPYCVSGSNWPAGVRVPKRVSRRVLPPPTAGTEWQLAHEKSLKMGPSPSEMVSAWRNSAFPAWNRESWSAVRPGRAAPKSATSASLEGPSASVPRTIPAKGKIRIENRRDIRPPFLGSRRESSRHLVSARFQELTGTLGRNRHASQLSRRTERGHSAREPALARGSAASPLGIRVVGLSMMYNKDQTPLVQSSSDADPW